MISNRAVVLESEFEKYYQGELTLNQLLKRVSNTTWEVDSNNLFYFLSLYRAFKSTNTSSAMLKIGEASGELDVTKIYPTAIASKELMNCFPITEYEDLLKKYSNEDAGRAVLWAKKMQAGSGSSVKRTKFLSRIKQIPESEVEIGGKGSDLYVKFEDEYLSIAEMQLVQTILLAKKKVFSRIVWHSIFSSETAKEIEVLWDKKCYLDKSLTYREIFEKFSGLELYKSTVQNYVPTIDENFKLSFERTAPAGHGLFGVDALLSALSNDLPKVGNGEVLISSIGNGEDLGSLPDGAIVNWMMDQQIPIVMMTTTKTGVDLKGGQLALHPLDRGLAVMTIVEKAQAIAANQSKYFEELGITVGNNRAYFNTNVVLINYTALAPFLKKLVSEIGEQEFQKIITPDLMKNYKKQSMDGKERTFCQLEGALGSVILNLDRYWRQKYQTMLVHVLNIGTENRSYFFAPVKNGFDFFMLYNSDRFKVSGQFRLSNLGNLLPPMAVLHDSIYEEVETVLALFKNCQIKNLSEFDVTGKIDFSEMELRNRVIVKSSYPEIVCLKCLLSSNILNNVTLVINEKKEITIS